jgi:hypothetical protein
MRLNCEVAFFIKAKALILIDQTEILAEEIAIDEN